ncbi:dual specificity protein phosphatase 22-like isoform X1 [Strongylocentrotus purpuratus]|uniref:Dual specificity protein phosphatase 15 n=1 Tax=Strongylocentrotus purpuratus TaxID=7668 RepID=A0A7M7G1B3_STRPU|nr:dual specificity protein phosphatase 22-like isoform X1 [Strongylocentrotus purpuratus]
MGNGMSEVLKGIFVGNFRDSKDETQLGNNNITHILSIHDNAKPIRPDKEYLCFSADDAPGQNLIQFFSESNNFIHKCRLEGGNVLIHCLAGVSRSVTLTVAYMMTVTDYKWEDCLRAVKTCRTVAHPNFGFQRQLQEYEYSKLAEYKEDIRLKFPEYLPEEDIKKMQALLEKYHQENKDPNQGREPHEGFIYPLPRNAYNIRIKKEKEAREKAEAQGSTGTTESTASATSEDSSENAGMPFADQQD